MTREARGATAPRQPRTPNPARVLERVRQILAETCAQDGQGASSQEVARRKAYRAGINRALREIDAHTAKED